MWVKDRAENGIATLADQAWLLGYLSGYAYSDGLDVLRNADNDSIFLVTDNYCRARPLDDIADAAVAVIKEVRKRN